MQVMDRGETMHPSDIPSTTRKQSSAVNNSMANVACMLGLLSTAQASASWQGDSFVYLGPACLYHEGTFCTQMHEAVIMPHVQCQERTQAMECQSNAP